MSEFKPLDMQGVILLDPNLTDADKVVLLGCVRCTDNESGRVVSGQTKVGAKVNKDRTTICAHFAKPEVRRYFGSFEAKNGRRLPLMWRSIEDLNLSGEPHTPPVLEPHTPPVGRTAQVTCATAAQDLSGEPHTVSASSSATGASATGSSAIDASASVSSPLARERVAEGALPPITPAALRAGSFPGDREGEGVGDDFPEVAVVDRLDDLCPCGEPRAPGRDQCRYHAECEDAMHEYDSNEAIPVAVIEEQGEEAVSS